MREQLKKALKLARKTNNPIIFFDAETPEDSFAIIDLDRYEKIVDSVTLDKKEAIYKPNLTEEDLADKINREISDWKNQEQSEYLAEESKSRRNWNIPPQIKNKAENHDK
ncbi:MAG TPA: hypothetical protein PLA05_02075 [bacterium]|nr:MAG: hypothetical protein BWX82_00628 [Parcubacteria group bacterium ADurb.Bin115]HNU81140.1 hypothetical protein [bacterium]HPW05731.1 hypothetical protein [bacterium]HQL34346.1 hypothetical protein [bacterium]